jgi:hypothetical protein
VYQTKRAHFYTGVFRTVKGTVLIGRRKPLDDVCNHHGVRRCEVILRVRQYVDPETHRDCVVHISRDLFYLSPGASARRRNGVGLGRPRPDHCRNATARAFASGSSGGSFEALPLGVCCTIRGTLIVAAWAGFGTAQRSRSSTARRRRSCAPVGQDRDRLGSVSAIRCGGRCIG